MISCLGSSWSNEVSAPVVEVKVGESKAEEVAGAPVVEVIAEESKAEVVVGAFVVEISAHVVVEDEDRDEQEVQEVLQVVLL